MMKSEGYNQCPFPLLRLIPSVLKSQGLSLTQGKKAKELVVHSGVHNQVHTLAKYLKKCIEEVKQPCMVDFSIAK